MIKQWWTKIVDYFKKPHLCDTGCQYSKDVGMWPQHSCSNGCIYKDKK
jgi:hypothetical protein